MSDTNSQSGRTIGLDMHPDIYSAAVLVGRDPGTAKIEGVWNALPTQDLVRWAKKNVLSSDIIVLEASGNSFAVARELTEVGFRVIVLESQRAGQIRKSYCNNDKSSAVRLARIYLTGLANDVWQPDKRTETRREILHAHRKCVTTTTRMRNRIKGYLNKQGVRLVPGTRLTSPNILDTLLRLQPWDNFQELILRQMLDELHSAEQRRKELRAAMARDLLSDPAMLKLVRLMGVRLVVAFALVAVIGDINRFCNHKKLVAYIGLSPSVDISGNSIKGNESLARYGRKDLRSLMIQAAHNALNQKASPLHKWGWKLILRKSNKNIAVVAVARKLTVAVWYLMRGLFTPLQEVTLTIQTKLKKIAAEVTLESIKAMGYPSKKAFLEEKHQLLLKTT